MSEKVGIIGAGLAGLTAGCTLKDAGVPFEILEARSTAGGRVRTLRLPDGLLVDLGGEHVPDIHFRLRHYLNRFKIGTTHLHDPPRQKVIWFRGKRVFIRPGSPITWPSDVPGATQGKSAGDVQSEFTNPVLPEVGDPADAGWPHPESLQFDDVSMADFLRRQGASQDQLNLFEIGLNSLDGEGFEVNSALFELCGSFGFRGHQTSDYIPGGSESLPQAMAAYLQGRIAYDSPVYEIKAKGNCFEITYGRKRSCLRCDHVIIAIPYSVLRDVKFTPALPAAKRDAIHYLRNTSVTRTFLLFKEPIWEDLGLSGAADTDQLIMSVYPGEPKKSHRAILESYTAGKVARELAKLPAAQRTLTTLEYVERLFPGIRGYYDSGISITWDGEEWAKGAYAYYAVGEMKKFYPQVAAPVGRIAFAGDHTTPQPGWMDSAIQSGERAAREILKLLSG